MGLQLAPGYIANNNDATPGPQTPFQHPVELDRNWVAAVTGQTGLFRAGDFAVTPGTGLTVSVSSGKAAILGQENNTQGSYFVWSNSADVVPVGAPAASTRYDSLLLRVADPQYGGVTGNSRAYYDLVAGVAGAGVPRADSYFTTGGGGWVPGAWFRLADIRVVPGASSFTSGDITSNIKYVSIPGGDTICTSGTRPSSPFLNQQIYETDTGLHHFYNGSAWKLMQPYKSTITLGSSQPSVTFSGMPNTLIGLRIMHTTRSDVAGTNVNIFVRINNDSGSNYSYNGMSSLNGGTTVSAFGPTLGTWGLAGNTMGAGDTSGRFASGTVTVPGWDSPHSRLSVLTQASFSDGVSAGNSFHGGFEYGGLGPYTSISFYPSSGNFVAGSRFTLEGWDI